MSEKTYLELADRALLSLSGPEARDFLQGIVSNDITRVGPSRAIYAALLTPQGKFLHDFLIVELDGALLVDCRRERIDDLQRRLMFYRLRAEVAIDRPAIDHRVFALFGADAAAALGLADEAGVAGPFVDGAVFVDPRLAALGARAILPADGAASATSALAAAGFTAGDSADYERLRLGLGVPDGDRDIPVDKGFLLESNFEELNGIDFQKGCYVGQELTARTKYRGTIRKRLFRVEIDGPLPAPGTPIKLGETEAGTMRSGLGTTGIALLKLDQVERAAAEGRKLTAAGATLVPVKPDWANF